MSRSGGVNVSKAGLITGVIAAIIICVCFIGYGLWEGSKYERQADNQSAEYAKYTSQKIAKACVGIPDLESIKCRYDALDAQREYEHNQRDLIAQRQSALWAYIMGAAAVIGMALSAFGVWLVKATFDETRRGNEIAASDAATNAHHLNQTRDAAVLSERAIVTIEPSLLLPPPLDIPNGFMAEIKVKNVGRSPARILRIDYYIDDIPTFRMKSRRFKRLNLLITPDKIERCQTFKLRAPRQYPKYFSGVVTYATIYNAEFFTYFCFKIESGLSVNVMGELQPKIIQPLVATNMPADT